MGAQHRSASTVDDAVCRALPGGSRYDRVVRAVLVLLTACTLGGGDNRPVTARPPRDPDRMSSDTLAHSNPRADTSHNKVFWRSEACGWFARHFTSCGEPEKQLPGKPFSPVSIGCGTCSTTGSGSAAGLLGALAVLLVVIRRRNKS
jgi:MYXO-CTERM domain-containing protein